MARLEWCKFIPFSKRDYEKKKMGSINDHKIDYNRARALRGQWHLSRKKINPNMPLSDDSIFSYTVDIVWGIEVNGLDMTEWLPQKYFGQKFGRNSF